MDLQTLLAQAEPIPWPAVYGAVVSTVALLVAGASLGWQIYQRRERGKARGEVGWRLGFVGPAPEFGLPEPVHVLIITVVNRDDVAVNVSMVGLMRQDGSEQWIKNPYHKDLGESLPGKVEARDSGQQMIPAKRA